MFANLVLADEINRATPRTQSSFLEAMEERQVTVDGATHPLPRPFLVLATQNPVELKGTFPLPEAQLDRFLLRLRMGYPTRDEEAQMLSRFRADDPLSAVTPVAAADDLLAARDRARAVHVADDVAGYIVALVRATREAAQLALGASPRSALALMRAAQAWAALDGRAFVDPRRRRRPGRAGAGPPPAAGPRRRRRTAPPRERRRAPADRGGRARRSDARRLARPDPGRPVPRSSELRTVVVCGRRRRRRRPHRRLARPGGRRARGPAARRRSWPTAAGTSSTA